MKKKTLLCFLLVLAALLGWLLWGNTALQTTQITVVSQKLPKGFDGCRIVQVSDLHNASFGRHNERLLDIIRDAAPDLIALTGDLVDSSHTDILTAVDFAYDAAQIAPCYYVTGNHEAWLDAVSYAILETELRDAGVTVLRNESVSLTRSGDTITLAGADDPAFISGSSMLNEDTGTIHAAIKSMALPENGFTVLLSHRPEVFPAYVSAGVDLALTGHAHGGQIRIPFVGGVIAPDQGLFPQYDAGLYQQGATSMIVSRGLGNSILPLRVNNRPEIVIVTLQCGE